MKIFSILLFCLALPFFDAAQITFERGYYINNLDQRIDGFIKNQDWKDNPSQFEFKNSENTAPTTITQKYAQEFGIEENLKYVRATVDLDRSSVSLNNLSEKRNPEFIEETLFLKVIVEGEARLYRYEEGNRSLYFYSSGDMGIKPLVYKKYLDKNQNLKTNAQYKQQLFNNLKCASVSMETIEKLRYQSSSLARFFKEFNRCKNPDYKNAIAEEKRASLHLNIRPGLKNAQADVMRYSTLGFPTKKTSLDAEWSFRLGLEAEFILPFNKDKWTIIVEPTYQYYKSALEENGTKTSADYKSLELPLGVRHYLFLNDRSKLFVNASFVLDFNLNSTIIFRDRSLLEVKSRNNFALGAGFKYDNRYSLEFRYELDRPLLGNYAYFASDYGSFSLIFGYTLF